MCNILDAWNNYLDTKTLKPNSLKKEINRFNLHLTSYWKDKSLESIKVRDILAYRKYLFDANLSPQSVKLCLALVRRLMRRAVQLELYSAPIPHFEMPRVDNRRIRFLTESEASQLFMALHAKSELWHDIALLGLNTGMRAGEIFSLRPSSVNFSQKSLILFETKNSQLRIVPLNSTAYGVVQKYYSKQLPYLFSENQIKQVSSIFRNAVQDINLNGRVTDTRDKFVFHSLRHTFASWLVQKGVPLIVVGNLLGHKGLQMTMRYAHLAPEQGKHAVDLLPNSISPHMESRKI